MKKLLLIAAAVIASVVGVSEAKQFDVPSANTLQPAPPGYGGVLVATSNFSTAFATASFGPCVVYGVTFSSGDISAFADVYATGTFSWVGQGAGSTATVRVFNTTVSSGGINPSGSYSSAGFVPVGPYPLRFRDGCGFKPSSVNFTNILLLYVPGE